MIDSAFRVCCLLALIGLGAHAQPPADSADMKPQPAPQERVEAIKQAFAESQKRLQSYEWIETTVLTLKGEEKSTKMQRCSYGPDGKVQKVPFGDGPDDESRKKGGIRGKIIDNKKQELTEYMEQAADLVHQYLPPEPEKIQACKDAGHAQLQFAVPGERARIAFNDYLLPKDSMFFDIDQGDNRILALGVSTYLGKEKDAVTLEVGFDVLPDGTSYQKTKVLVAKAKDIKVTITNSAYRNLAPQ